MESLAIALWIAGGLVTAPIFCFVLATYIRPHRTVARIFFYPAVFGLCLLTLDLLAVGWVGAVRSRELIGPAFFPIHTFVTLVSPAFLAGSLLLGERHFARRWIAVAGLSWMLGVFSIFYQYGVAEALYGIDGLGGPYSNSR